MKIKPISVHIVVSTKSDLGKAQNISVKLTKSGQIKQFRHILNNQSNERAIIFALSKGKLIQPDEAKNGVQLILTKENTYWDLIG